MAGFPLPLRLVAAVLLLWASAVLAQQLVAEVAVRDWQVDDLLQVVRIEVTKLLMTVEIRSPEQVEESEPRADVHNVQYHHSDYEQALAEAATERQDQPFVRPGQKVGRNDPCPCGSGKKYKHCHGKDA